MLIKMIKKINDLLQGNCVFVGGVAEVIHGTKKYYNDIDLVCPDPTPLLEIAPMRVYTNSLGKWARITPKEGKQIDIWIKPLVDFIEIEGIKYATIQEMTSHYEDLLTQNIEDKKVIIAKLNRLRQ